MRSSGQIVRLPNSNISTIDAVHAVAMRLARSPQPVFKNAPFAIMFGK